MFYSGNIGSADKLRFRFDKPTVNYLVNKVDDVATAVSKKIDQQAKVQDELPRIWDDRASSSKDLRYQKPWGWREMLDLPTADSPALPERLYRPTRRAKYSFVTIAVTIRLYSLGTTTPGLGA